MALGQRRVVSRSHRSDNVTLTLSLGQASHPASWVPASLTMSTQRTRPNRDIILVVQLQSQFLGPGQVFCSDVATPVLRDLFCSQPFNVIIEHASGMI